jgi:hypothetical protein
MAKQVAPDSTKFDPDAYLGDFNPDEFLGVVSQKKPAYMSPLSTSPNEQVGQAVVDAMKNAPSSFGDLASGMGQVGLRLFTNPTQVLGDMASIPIGAGMKYGTSKIMPIKPENQEYIDKYNALENAYKERYSSGPLAAFAKDPFGVAIDASAILGGGGALAKGAGLTRTGAALSGAASAVDPFAIAGKAVRSAIPAKAPEWLYRKALSASPASYSDAEIRRAIATGIRERIAVAPKDYVKMKETIGNIRQQVDGIISRGSQSGATVDATIPLSNIQEAIKQAQRSTLPGDALKGIQKMVDQQLESIVQRYPNGQVPAVEAQAIKRELQRELDPFYGELKGSLKTAAKGIVSGWRQELEQLFPAIKNLNSQNSDLIQLEEMMRGKVHKQLNSPLIPMNPTSVGGTIAATSGGFGVASAVYSAGYELKNFLELPGVKSKLALILDKAKKAEMRGSKVLKPLSVGGRTIPIMSPPQIGE